MEYINIAFTGHRPNRLYGYDLNNPRYKQLSKILKKLLDKIDYDNPGKGLKGVVGGALGFDTLAYNTLYNKKMSGEFPEYNSLKIEMAIPFRNQNIKWNYIDKVKYSFCLEHSDKITYVDKEEKYKIKGVQEDIYHISKMQKRNEYMVDNCDLLIACWSGVKKGGTYNCVKYAIKNNKRIIVINPNDFKIKKYNFKRGDIE